MKSEAECKGIATDIVLLETVAVACELAGDEAKVRVITKVITNMRERLKKEEAVSGEKTVDEMLTRILIDDGVSRVRTVHTGSCDNGPYAVAAITVTGDLRFTGGSLHAAVSALYAKVFPPKPREWEVPAMVDLNGEIHICSLEKVLDVGVETIRVKVIEIPEEN